MSYVYVCVCFKMVISVSLPSWRLQNWNSKNEEEKVEKETKTRWNTDTPGLVFFIDWMCIINGFIGKRERKKSLCVVCWVGGWEDERGLARGNGKWIKMRSKVFPGSKPWLRRFFFDRRSISRLKNSHELI